MGEKLSRRDFLEVSGLELFTLILAGSGLSGFIYSMLKIGGWDRELLNRLNYHGGEFNPVPEGCEDIGQHDHCWVWVHPYYGLHHAVGYSDNPAYSDYLYLAGLKRLANALSQTDELVILWEEEAVFQQGEVIAAETPTRCSLRVATRPTGGDMADFIRTPAGVLKQDPTALFKILRTAGVQEGWFVGSEPGGCVSMVARDFQKNNLAIRGVKGLLFPPDDQGQLAQDLYSNQIDPAVVLAGVY